MGHWKLHGFTGSSTESLEIAQVTENSTGSLEIAWVTGNNMGSMEISRGQLPNGLVVVTAWAY